MKCQQKHMAQVIVMTLRQVDGLKCTEGRSGQAPETVGARQYCLWRAVSDLALDKMMLSEVARAFSLLAAELVVRVIEERGASERWVCTVLGQHRSTQRKVVKAPDNEAALTGAQSGR